MQTTDLWRHEDSAGRWTDRAAVRCILVQREVGPAPLVIRDVGEKELAQMSLIDKMTRSKHSRRMDPIKRSTYGLYHGLMGLEIASEIPMPVTRRRKAAL